MAAPFIDVPPRATAVVAAFAGPLPGRRRLSKATMPGLRLVGALALPVPVAPG